MTYEIDYDAAERAGFSSKIMIADRVTFYTKLFASGPTRYFSADQKGNVDKEITKTELDVCYVISSTSLSPSDARVPLPRDGFKSF